MFLFVYRKLVLFQIYFFVVLSLFVYRKFYFEYIYFLLYCFISKFYFKYIFLLHCFCLSLDNFISNNIYFYIFLNLIRYQHCIVFVSFISNIFCPETLIRLIGLQLIPYFNNWKCKFLIRLCAVICCNKIKRWRFYSWFTACYVCLCMILLFIQYSVLFY